LNFNNFLIYSPLIAILTRLDDPSSEVRARAAQCLGVLQLERDDEENHSRWDEVLGQLFSIMVLHLENPELKLRTAILGELKHSPVESF
jgi:hypothetical protein